MTPRAPFEAFAPLSRALFAAGLTPAQSNEVARTVTMAAAYDEPVRDALASALARPLLGLTPEAQAKALAAWDGAA